MGATGAVLLLLIVLSIVVAETSTVWACQCICFFLFVRLTYPMAPRLMGSTMLVTAWIKHKLGDGSGASALSFGTTLATVATMGDLGWLDAICLCLVAGAAVERALHIALAASAIVLATSAATLTSSSPSKDDDSPLPPGFDVDISTTTGSDACSDAQASSSQATTTAQ